MSTRRPYDRDRPPGLKRKDGFALDLLNSRRVGQRTTTTKSASIRSGPQWFYKDTPAYYERHPTKVDASGKEGKGRKFEGDAFRLTYWLLSAVSYPPGRPQFVVEQFRHEGDWERISVLIRRLGRSKYMPLSVRYHIHKPVSRRAVVRNEARHRWARSRYPSSRIQR